MHVKVDDIVELQTGDETKGREGPLRGRVLRVLPAVNKVIVEGANRVYKHVRRSQRNPQGGRLSKEMPIDASNILPVCESCNKATRVGRRYRDDGSKERFCKKCGAGMGLIAPPRAAYAKKK
jgi:large subunit ribosomal protein L24